MPRLLIALAVTAFVVFTSTSASAQVAPKGLAGGKPGAGAGAAVAAPNLLMQALDTDKDGTISASELRKAVKSLKGLDRNRDGTLTPDELKPAAGAMGAAPALGKPAAGAGARGAAGGFPAGGGGARAGFGAGAGGGGFGPLGGNPNVRGGGGFSSPGSGTLNKIMGFDRNRDGRVSKSEIPPQLHAWFKKADLNRDGSVDPKELRMFGARGAGVGR